MLDTLQLDLNIILDSLSQVFGNSFRSKVEYSIQTSGQLLYKVFYFTEEQPFNVVSFVVVPVLVALSEILVLKILGWLILSHKSIYSSCYQATD